MFIAALLIIAQMRVYPKFLSNCEWINRMSYSYIMEYHSEINSNEVLIYAITWMNLKSS